MQKQIVDSISELFDVKPNQIRSLNQYFYPYTNDGGDFVARVLQEPSYAEQTTEVSWINYLASDGVRIVRAVPSVNGELVEEICAGGEQFLVVSLERAEGAPPTNAEWDRNLFKQLGQQIGRMHRATQKFHIEYPALQRTHWHEADIYDVQRIPERFSVARAKCSEVVHLVRSYQEDAGCYGLIHGDIGPCNIHVHNNQVTFFDTDECELHFFAHDLGVLINFAVDISFNGTDVNGYAEAFVGSLLEGYAEYRDLSSVWIERLPIFVKLREVMSFIDAFLEWDMSQISLHKRILLNRYQNAIENEVALVDIDYKQFA